jgi:F-type H+-transporting ATPase subunit delta
MNTGLISTRYATALLKYSVELNQQKEVYSALRFFLKVYGNVLELRKALHTNSVTKSEKKKIFITACGGTVPSSLREMLELVMKNERHGLLHYIALRFVDLYRERFNIQHGKLVTAVSMDEETKEHFVKRIESIIDKRLEIEAEVDPDIIGGFLLYLDDHRLDASVSGKLNRIRSKVKKM